MDPSTSAFSTPVCSTEGNDRESLFPSPPTHPFLQDACCTDASTHPQCPLPARTTHPSLSCNMRKLTTMYSIYTITSSHSAGWNKREWGDNTDNTHIQLSRLTHSCRKHIKADSHMITPLTYGLVKGLPHLTMTNSFKGPQQASSPNSHCQPAIAWPYLKPIEEFRVKFCKTHSITTSTHVPIAESDP